MLQCSAECPCLPSDLISVLFFLFTRICTSQALKSPTDKVCVLALTPFNCHSVFYFLEKVWAPLMNKSQIIFSQTQSHTTARAAIWQCAAGLKG